ncbi:MAG: carboxypeptidase-like regulatory domain-containing protein [Fermentimonas sp.]
MRRVLLAAMMFVTSLLVSEQVVGAGVSDCVDQNQKKVHGVVKSNEGNLMPNVMVMVKGANEYTITDENGVYELNAGGDDTLVFSYLGYKDYEMRSADGETIDVVLYKSDAPLVIVDGEERSLSDVTPEEIKSVNVLKGETATSLYGERGANGVVLIETHVGVTGKQDGK